MLRCVASFCHTDAVFAFWPGVRASIIYPFWLERYRYTGILFHHQCSGEGDPRKVCRRFALDSILLLNAFGHREKERDFLRMRLVAEPLKSAHSVFAPYREDRNENIWYSAAIPEKALRGNDVIVSRY